MGFVDWIILAQNRDRWRALVNTALNLEFPYNANNFLRSSGTLSFSSWYMRYGFL